MEAGKQKDQVCILKMHHQAKEDTRRLTEDKGVSLVLIRDTFTKESTIGKLYINGESFCDTLENPWLDNQRNISCIPEGQYKVRLRLLLL